MNKGELVDAIASSTGTTKKNAEEVLNAALQVITETVASGEKVTLVGFGTFEPRDRQGRTGRNPASGEVIQIPACTVPGFKPGKEFKEKVAS